MTTKNQPWKMSGVNQKEGTACAKAWGRKESGRSEEQKERGEFWEAQFLNSPGRRMNCHLGDCALHLCALTQLLQVKDFVAQVPGQQKALTQLHEESRDLVAVQEAICLPAVTDHAGHRPPLRLWGHKCHLALPCPCSLVPSLAIDSVTQRCFGERESPSITNL